MAGTGRGGWGGARRGGVYYVGLERGGHLGEAGMFCSNACVGTGLQRGGGHCCLMHHLSQHKPTCQHTQERGVLPTKRQAHTLLVRYQLSKAHALCCCCCCCYCLPPKKNQNSSRPLAALRPSPPTSSSRISSSQHVRQSWRYSRLHAKPAA